MRVAPTLNAAVRGPGPARPRARAHATAEADQPPSTGRRGGTAARRHTTTATQRLWGPPLIFEKFRVLRDARRRARAARAAASRLCGRPGRQAALDIGGHGRLPPADEPRATFLGAHDVCEGLLEKGAGQGDAARSTAFSIISALCEGELTGTYDLAFLDRLDDNIRNDPRARAVRRPWTSVLVDGRGGPGPRAGGGVAPGARGA